VTEDLSGGLVCEDYTEEEIESDMNAVDWQHASNEIELIESEKRAKQLEMIQKQERMKAKEEFERL